jgi:hypothetical protein
MKRKILPKSLLLTAVVFSLFSFVFVNLHAHLVAPQAVCTKPTLEQPQVKECDDDTDTQDIKVPDVAVIGRVFELVQKIISVTN